MVKLKTFNPPKSCHLDLFLDKNKTYIFKHDIRSSNILSKIKKCFKELNNKFTLIRNQTKKSWFTV